MFANGGRRGQKNREQRQRQNELVSALTSREREIYETFDGRGRSWWEDGNEKRVWLEYDLRGRRLTYRTSGFGMFASSYEKYSIACDIAREISREEGVSMPNIYEF